MKKVAVFFAFGLIAATFVACSSPAEVKTRESGEGALIGASVGDAESGEGNSRVILD